MHAGPRPVQTEVNATRILLRGPYGHLHLTKKASSNGRAFLLLAARADGHRNTPEANWNSCWQHELQCRAGVARNAGTQVSNQIPMPGEVGVSHRYQVPEQDGHQPAGVPVNAWARTAVTYPGFT